jgi:hypothetical protein
MYIHNNENYDDSSPHTTLTTGLVLDLDLTNKTVTAARRIWNADEPIFSTSQGSYQNLTNGHALMFHGSDPLVEEYDAAGACVMSARFGRTAGGMEGYRAYRAPWVGRPQSRPSVVVCAGEGKGVSSGEQQQEEEVAVYVSWNGASDVQGWKIYAGPEERGLRVVRTAMKNGFETRATVDGVSGGDVVIVQAVGGVNDGTRSEAVLDMENCN